MPFPRAKATLYDSGTRVPLAVRWGEQVKGGRVVSDFVSLCDFAPTFLEAGGVSKGKRMTGNSLLPLLRSVDSGQVEAARTHVLTGNERHCFLYPSRALRNKNFLYIRNFNPGEWDAGDFDGDTPIYDFASQPWPTGQGAFSYNIDPGPSKQAMRLDRSSPQAQLAFAKRPKEELYDLKVDPDQLRNVASDKRYEASLQRLREQLTSELKTSQDPRFKTD